MTATERREKQRLDTRERILDAAQQLLLTAGVEGFSMRKLAAKIDYTATAIYFHFPDKETLLSALMDREFTGFRQAFDRFRKVDCPLVRLHKMGLAYIDFALEYPDHYRLMFMTPAVSEIPKGGTIERGNPAQDCYAFLRLTVQQGLSAGLFRPEYRDADQLAQIIFAATHGIASLHIAKGKDDWVDWRPIRPKARKMTEAILRGLTVRDDQATQDLSASSKKTRKGTEIVR